MYYNPLRIPRLPLIPPRFFSGGKRRGIKALTPLKGVKGLEYKRTSASMLYTPFRGVNAAPQGSRSNACKL